MRAPDNHVIADDGEDACGAPPVSDDADSASGQAADPLSEIRDTIVGLRDAGTDYLRTSLDGIRGSAQRMAIKLALTAGAAFATLTLVLAGLVLLLVGAAQLVSAALGLSSAAGYFLIGLIAVAAPVI